MKTLNILIQEELYKKQSKDKVSFSIKSKKIPMYITIYILKDEILLNDEIKVYYEIKLIGHSKIEGYGIIDIKKGLKLETPFEIENVVGKHLKFKTIKLPNNQLLNIKIVIEL